ncbi:GerAB/ArcD/ProY family transporter [Paenibacillus sp. M1]|uniref:GerAB/ArcD/ProY family transporter n=1 Tax=Paenibacillus haidiansis TaxID=1574488 RepID=A0ABU7VKE7_9BACL
MQKSVTAPQIFSLFNLHLFTTANAFLQGTLIASSHFTAPLATIAGGLLSLVLVYPSYKVASSRPDEFLTEFGGQLVGRIPNAVLILYIVLIKILLSAVNLRQMSDYLLTVYLINTPSWAVVLIFAICIAYAVRSGLTSIFRAAQGIFMISALAALIIPFLAMKEIEGDALIALATHFNFTDLGRGVYYNLTMFGELSFLFLLYPYLREPKKIMRSYFITTIVALVIIMSHLIPVLLTFGEELAPNLLYPDVELIRFIRAGSFIETLDPILIILWLTSIFVKISYLSFSAVICISQLTGIKDNKPLALPIVAFIGVLSIVIARSHTELGTFMAYYFGPFLLVGEIVIPAIYWGASAVRGKKNNAKPAASNPAGS